MSFQGVCAEDGTPKRTRSSQLLQAIGTEVAAEIRSIADKTAAVKRLAVSRAEEKL